MLLLQLLVDKDLVPFKHSQHSGQILVNYFYIARSGFNNGETLDKVAICRATQVPEKLLQGQCVLRFAKA